MSEQHDKLDELAALATLAADPDPVAAAQHVSNALKLVHSILSDLVSPPDPDEDAPLKPKTILDCYNQHRGPLAEAASMTEKRRTLIHRRVRDFAPDSYDIAWWARVFAAAARSKAHNGQGTGWRADFTWIMKTKDNTLKFIELAKSPAPAQGRPQPRGAAGDIQRMREERFSRGQHGPIIDVTRRR